MKFKLIWYDLESEKGTDIVEALTRDEAINQGYEKYNGNPPGKMVTVVEID